MIKSQWLVGDLNVPPVDDFGVVDDVHQEENGILGADQIVEDPDMVVAVSPSSSNARSPPLPDLNEQVEVQAFIPLHDGEQPQVIPDEIGEDDQSLDQQHVSHHQMMQIGFTEVNLPYSQKKVNLPSVNHVFTY